MNHIFSDMWYREKLMFVLLKVLQVAGNSILVFNSIVVSKIFRNILSIKTISDYLGTTSLILFL